MTHCHFGASRTSYLAWWQPPQCSLGGLGAGTAGTLLYPVTDGRVCWLLYLFWNYLVSVHFQCSYFMCYVICGTVTGVISEDIARGSPQTRHLGSRIFLWWRTFFSPSLRTLARTFAVLYTNTLYGMSDITVPNFTNFAWILCIYFWRRGSKDSWHRSRPWVILLLVCVSVWDSRNPTSHFSADPSLYSHIYMY